MNLKELLEQFNDHLFDADLQRNTRNFDRFIIKIEDLI